MKAMVIVKASEASEAGEMPPPEMFAAMGKFNEELIDAGIMVVGGGLAASSRVRPSGPDLRALDRARHRWAAHRRDEGSSSPGSGSGMSLHYKKRSTG